MRIITDHDTDYVVRMDCESCMVTTTVSSLSPVVGELAAIFAATHALCETEGHPDLNAMVDKIIDLRVEHPTYVAFADAAVEHANEIAESKRNSIKA